MNELIIAHDQCERCGATFAGADNFCSNCGLPIIAPSDAIVTAEIVAARPEMAVVKTPQSTVVIVRETSPITTVLENRFYVIAILACAGPIGLPALWFSSRFTRRCKIITTVGYFLFTVVLPLAVAWYFLDIAVQPVVDALSR